MRFFVSALTVPISEAICETWVSVIDLMNKQRLRSEDDIRGANDERTFIKINGPPSGCENTRKCLKEELNLMHGTNYSLHFTNIYRNKKLGKVVASEIVNHVNDEAECLSCFK
ncbi:hypothetical protein AVEN_265899-1 [Araneus ventricosus]|uniref:Uncharacterized protein n=1 Tax=Araneus ventricosus TaxID=182803 RepID=A0A4Y2JGY3_ARAVE|nr:hypothetical protein AVEN_265899-1 [Araneus ventricosus]